jgi:hypothetical protein
MHRREESLLMPTLDVLHKSTLTRYQLRHIEEKYFLCIDEMRKPATLVSKAEDHILIEIDGHKEEFIIIGEINE